MPTFLRRTLYAILGLLALVLLLIIVVVVALQFPATQDFAARKASSYLEGKLGTTVRIGKFRTDFRHAISLDKVYFEDQQKDTLLAVGHLGVNLDLWALTKSEINLSSLELNDGTLHLTRSMPDSVTNYDYILAAFASGDTTTTTPADTTGGFTYNVGDVRLTNIFLTYKDEVDGNDVRTRVGELAVAMDEVNVDKSIYKVNTATLRNTGIKVVQSKVPPETPSEPLTLTFGLNKAVLDNVDLTYRNSVAAQYINTHVGQAEATADNIDLINSRIDLNTLTLRNSTLAYTQNENVPVEQRAINPAEAVRDLNESVEKATGESTSWVVTLKQSDLRGVDVAFDNFDEPKLKGRGMDYNHLKFSGLALNTQNLAYTENRTTVRINQLAGREQSGFRIDSTRADVVFDSVQARLDNLDLITPHTRIRQTIAIGYKNLDALADEKQLPNLRVEADLRNTRVGFRDILYLAPDLAGTPPFNTGANQSVLVSGRVNGRVGDLRVQNLDFVGFRNTVVQASGRIVGLPNVDERLYTDLVIKRFSTSEADLKSLLPKGTIPAEYELPDRMSVAGTLRGRPIAQVFDANLRATTSFGNVAAVVDMRPGPKGQEPINATFSTQNFNVGKILRDPTIGTITASGRLNARGLDPAQMRGKLVANVQSARYNGYTYRGVVANVDIDRQRYVIDAKSRQDPNLNLDLLATVNLRDANNPSYTVERLNLRGANLTALGFYTGGNLSVQGDLTANLSGSDANSLNGTFSGRRIVIISDGKPIAIDSLQGRIVQRPGRTEVALTSNVLNANLNGNVPLGDIAGELQRHIDRYFDLPDVQYRPTAADRRFTFDARVLNAKILPQFVPGLTRISPFALTGSYDSRAANLTVNSQVPVIVYQGYRLDSTRLSVGSDPQKLDYAVKMRQASQDTSLRLPNPSLVGSIANNRIGTNLRIAESDSAQKLNVAGVLQVINQGDAYAFSFDPNLVLNNQKWAVAPNNEVRYTMATGAIRANNVRLSQGSQFIELQTLAGAEYPLQARLGNLDLNQLAVAGGMQDSLVGGTLNGQAVVKSIGQPRMAFTSDLALTSFAYNKTVLGDLTLKASNPVADRYDVDGRLTSKEGNDVTATGYYLAAGSLNMDVNVNRLFLKTAEPFSMGQLAESTGALTGRLAVTGTTTAPQVRGQLTTQDMGFTLTQLGAPYRLPAETMVFDEQGIKLDDFTILDSLGNKAEVNGYVYTKNFIDDYRFDLNAVTDDFLAVQSTRRENPLFYGRLVVDSDTRITGDLNLPRIRTDVTAVGNSDLTLVVPNDDPVVVEREGIVQFVDFSNPTDTLLARQQREQARDTMLVAAAGYDIRATIHVTDKTPFTLVVDDASGDNLKVRANGTLNTQIDATGNISMTGRLGVTQGKYQMSLYDLASREFDIAEGSFIVWNGTPLDATANVSAIYRVKTAPAPLLAGQGEDDPIINTVARNRVPFDIYLNVNGDLLKPVVSFDIKLPEGEGTDVAGPVNARLAQLRQPNEVTELNKQVFAVLVLGRFIGDNPLRSTDGGGTFVGNQLRGSASEVLTDQLNSLTGEYLGGLGLELGVDSRTEIAKSGEEQNRTDLNVAVRRQLLNDRLSVRIGTDVPIGGGGNQTAGSATTSAFAGNVSVEYSILPDGRLRLRAFSQNAYDDIDGGSIVRNGGALIFQRDYRDLKELFSAIPKDIKEERKVNRRRDREEKKAERDTIPDNANN
ncbi:translocation/assembly module TamB domain-containing protein [Hymenobacter sp. BT175]|uniref:translocation/assembly module TamB domain-containing protein n=1 Tax=Hymenobacter translucens TaxID=2886507 RepID=UPI001D0DCDB4|nr:translocation/assembly module TamB domain-containing protein [Hymenobacter translucens]MCC2545570.1 translocation/assembly module TamB domain-containing protein [Hymenobacter translucens]